MSDTFDYDGYVMPDDNFCEVDSMYKKYLTGKLSWITKEKKAVLISDMTVSHIENCLKIPKYSNKKKWNIVFKFELGKRNYHLTNKIV